MGSLNPFGGGGGKTGSSSYPSNATGSGYNSIAPYANVISGIGGTQLGYGNNLLGSGQGQYNAGVTGQLTPAQAALTQETLKQMDLGTASTYANLGLPGSTMQTQDTNANQLASLTQTEGILSQDEQLGLAAMAQGSGMLQSGASDFGNAASITNTQNQQYLQQLSSAKNALGSLAGQSAGSGSGTGGTGGAGSGGGILSSIGNLFGGSGKSGSGNSLANLSGGIDTGGAFTDLGGAATGASAGSDLSGLVDSGAFSFA